MRFDYPFTEKQKGMPQAKEPEPPKQKPKKDINHQVYA
jgi:hypothetical protein